MNVRALLALSPALCLVTTHAAADITVFLDVAAFRAQTGASPQPAIPALGLVGRHVAQVTVGDLTFSINNQSPEIALVLDEFTPLHPAAGDAPCAEIATSDWEALDVSAALSVFALGSFFIEGTNQPLMCNGLCPCADATYQVRLLSGGAGGVEVGRFTFNAPDDVLSFVGVWSSVPFDRVEYRDLSQQCDNEVWGRFFLGLTPPPPACPADFNGDGFLDFFDADAFVACFEGVECPPGKDADFNHDGFADFFDADAFVEAFEAGC